MRITFLILSVFLSLVTLENSRGQFYDTGTDPASIKWYQIKTDNYRIVFPHSYMKEAGTTAQTLERAYQSLSGTYEEGKRRYRTNVIIHSYSTESNGYVAWAPRRMELYPSPQQNSIPQSHNRQLLFHESVHVRQLKSLEQGFSGFMNLILGQQFTGILSVLVPEWFFEGDAVYYETLLNPGGRGQNPAFNKDIKALYGAKPSGFSYDKMLFGSYRDHTPNHYQFGSLMMEYSRSKYGDDLWKNTLSYTAKFPFLLNPVNLKLNSTEKLKKKKLFKETFNNLHADWEKERLLDNSIEYNSVSPIKEESYINYHSPVVISSDSIFAIKTSLYKPSSIVLIKDNGISEETITMPGIMYPYLLAGGGGKLTWAEHAPDPRWENRNYSVIVVYDLKTKMSRRITSRTRYTAPSLSSNGMFIAASENSVEDANSLVMINSMDGEIIRKIPTPDNGFPQRPRWSDDDSLITVILLTDNGEGVFNYSIYKDKWEQLLPPEHTDLQDALVRNDTLFFVSSITGTDNLFIRDKEGSVSRITRSQFGLSNFSLDGNEVIFSDYTAQGNYLGAASIKGDGYPYFKPGKTPSSETEAVSDSISFPQKRYRKMGHLFSFHSWMPFYADLDEISSDPLAVTPGVTLFSQNLMSSLITSLGYEYTNNSHIFHSGITWKGWYPVIDFNISYGGDPAIIRSNYPDENPSEVSPDFRTETEIYIPFSFSTGKYSQYFKPSFGHTYVNRYIYMAPDGPFDEGQQFFTGRLYFSNVRRSSYRDIFPVWGQTFDFLYTSSPFDKDLYGTLTTLRTTFYFPGVFKNNGLRVRLQTEKQNPVRFLHFNRAMFPRGYTDIISEKLNTLSADYAFPIAYPDLAAGSLFYLKRLRGSLFYDVSEGWNNRYLAINEYHEGYELFNSMGGELLADFSILRIPFDITAGGRVGYVPGQGRTFIEAVFNINIYGYSLGK